MMIETKFNRVRRSRSPGFTLTELLVAVAILVAMMTLIATIFSTAGKAAGTAQSSQKLYRQSQQAAEAIKRDLDMMGEGALNRVLAIAGVQATTVERPDDPAATARPRRADVMMLVTPRRVSPYLAQGVTSDDLNQIKHVVYGHARIGKILPSGWSNVHNLDQIPASKWHLARRVTGFLSMGATPPTTGGHGGTLVDDEFINGVDDPQKLADVHLASFGTSVNSSLPDTIFPGYYAYQFQSANSAKLFSYAISHPLGRFTFNPMRLDPNPFDYYWLQTDPNIPGSPLLWWKEALGTTGWGRTDTTGIVEYPSAASPPAPTSPGGNPPNAAYFVDKGFPTYWPQWFYTGDDTRVVLDPNPDPAVGGAKRLASYFLPGCSEFKVEVTFDRIHELPVISDGSNYGVPMTEVNGDGTVDEFDGPVPTAIQWEPVPPGEVWVWYNTKSSPYADPSVGDSRQYTDPFVWPTAIRITITAYDPAANLDHPITTTIIHKF